jgi:hypothetical protein
MFLLTVLVYVAALAAIFFVLKWLKIQISNYAEMSKVAGPPQEGVIIGNMWYLQGTPGKPVSSDISKVQTIPCRTSFPTVA